MKCKISKEEIGKMLKDQLRVAEVKWDKKGNAEVEIELQKMTDKPAEHHYYPYYVRPCHPVWTPVYSGGVIGATTSSISLNYGSAQSTPTTAPSSTEVK